MQLKSVDYIKVGMASDGRHLDQDMLVVSKNYIKILGYQSMKILIVKVIQKKEKLFSIRKGLLW